jgi:hypothetical protein
VYYLDFRCGSGTLCANMTCAMRFGVGNRMIWAFVAGCGVVCYVTAFKIGKAWVVQNGKFDVFFIEAQLRAVNKPAIQDYLTTAAESEASDSSAE